MDVKWRSKALESLKYYEENGLLKFPDKLFQREEFIYSFWNDACKSAHGAAHDRESLDEDRLIKLLEIFSMPRMNEKTSNFGIDYLIPHGHRVELAQIICKRFGTGIAKEAK